MEGLEYIAPLKQSNKIIGEYDMLDNICMTLKGYVGGTVLCKKVKTRVYRGKKCEFFSK